MLHENRAPAQVLRWGRSFRIAPPVGGGDGEVIRSRFFSGEHS
jgi:hypothetical protein